MTRNDYTYYAVVVGREPGIYRNWGVAQPLVEGFSGALYKKFKTLQEAKEFGRLYWATREQMGSESPPGSPRRASSPEESQIWAWDPSVDGNSDY